MFKTSANFLLAIVAVSAGVVSAQSVADAFNSLSSTCKTSLQAVIVAPEAQCLNLGAFLSAAVAGGTIDVPTLANTWLTGLCAVGSCSQASLSAIVNNVTSGCATDVQNVLQVDISNPSQVLPWVIQYYPPVRQIACLKDTQTNTLCVPQTLTNLQSVIGPIGSSSWSPETINADVQKLVGSNYSTLACTSCIKSAYNIVSEVFPDPNILDDASPAITSTCGASFIDGQSVATVSETAAGGDFAVKTTDSSAVSFTPLKAGSIIVAISSIFVAFV